MEHLSDWKVWVGGAVMAVVIYGFLMLFSFACVAAGHAPEVCGL